MAAGMSLAGGVIKGVSDGFSSYYNTKQTEQNYDFQNQMRDWQYQGQLGQTQWQDAYNDDLYKHLKTLPNLSYLQLPGVNSGIHDYLRQGKFIPQMSAMSSKINQAFQAQIGQVAPDFIPAFQKTAANALSWASGDIDPDTARDTQMKSAEMAQAAGLGTNSGQYRNLVARDFGTTSMDLKTKAANLIPMLASVSSSLAPAANIQSLLLNPQQLMERNDNWATTNWNVDNQNLERQYQRTMPEPPHMADYMPGSPPQLQYKGMSPWLSAINTFWGSVGSSLGGGAGKGLMGNPGGGGATT